MGSIYSRRSLCSRTRAGGTEGDKGVGMINKDKIELSVRRNKVWLNGLIVGVISYSETLNTYWLRMQNIDDTLIEANTQELAIDEAKSIVKIWLDDLISDLT